MFTPTITIDKNTFESRLRFDKRKELDLIKSIYKSNQPFERGIINNSGIEFAFWKGEENWFFSLLTTGDNSKFVEIEKYRAIGLLPMDKDYWLSEKGKNIIWFYLMSFVVCQEKALHNQKKIYKAKDYESKEHEYEPIEINQPIKISNGVQIIFSDNSEEVRDYIRHIEAWGVRGHERHLKNGKVIFVKPYTKGKGKVKETNYEIT